MFDQILQKKNGKRIHGIQLRELLSTVMTISNYDLNLTY